MKQLFLTLKYKGKLYLLHDHCVVPLFNGTLYLNQFKNIPQRVTPSFRSSVLFLELTYFR